MEHFQLEEGIEIIDLFLYLTEFDALVIGDAHLGYEESLTRQGVMIPKFQFEEIIKRTKEVLEEVKPEIIIVVGDLKHEFGRISQEEWRDTLEFIDLLKEYGEVILIEGNHDKILKPIADKRDLEVEDHYILGDYYFCHGHKLPKDLDYQNASTIIMGHEHPALGLRDGERVEVYKCFLKGKYKDKEVIVLPSLSSLPEGTDIMREQVMSPFLKDVKNFQALVVEEKVYDFGKIKDLKEKS